MRETLPKQRFDDANRVTLPPTIIWPNEFIFPPNLDFPEIRGFPFLSYLSGAQVL